MKLSAAFSKHPGRSIFMGITLFGFCMTTSNVMAGLLFGITFLTFSSIVIENAIRFKKAERAARQAALRASMQTPQRAVSPPIMGVTVTSPLLFTANITHNHNPTTTPSALSAQAVAPNAGHVRIRLGSSGNSDTN